MTVVVVPSITERVHEPMKRHIPLSRRGSPPRPTPDRQASVTATLRQRHARSFDDPNSAVLDRAHIMCVPLVVYGDAVRVGPLQRIQTRPRRRYRYS
jgi:hypothetical protein